MMTLILIAFLLLFVILFFSLLYQHTRLHVRFFSLEQQCADLRSTLADAKRQLRVHQFYEQGDPYDYERAYQRSRLSPQLRCVPPVNGDILA